MKTSVNIYHMGLLSCSVCAPADLEREAVEDAVNALIKQRAIEEVSYDPKRSATVAKAADALRWRISKDRTFRSGDAMPCVCEQDPTRRHWLLEC